MHRFDLLVVGDANPDVIIGPLRTDLEFGQREQLADSGVLTLGGSGAITAAGAARLGLRVAVAGRVGDDAAGRFVRDALEERGVDTGALRTDPVLPTPLTTVLTRDGDRAIITAPGTLAALTAADVPPELLATSRHVHSSSYFLLPGLAPALPALLRTARGHGATTSVDTNDDPAGAWDTGDLLGETDFLLPNAAEVSRLADVTDAREAAALLGARGPAVVVKDGAGGAFAHRDGEIFTAQGIPAEAVDTVGAGDSFNAGFLAGVLAGLPLGTALRCGVVCGGSSVRAAGGTAGQATWDDVLVHLERIGSDRS
ncbi:carbohydrate kinase family protein [Amycolatopsis alba]|uniref:Carbohydrate kinase family protein n=1 Tax=Amycolatopsis alba DSM 44262 TaxID=1125972 RepID=A0A229S7V7_AMYAL|nr:carbohydrate kinase family protein [Amycolatopsis alba]OXM54905.1 carbohydrate kinase family protein [Amycolatopsis alba DSM 44262]